MQRVFDFSPSDHEVVVSRILVQVHQAVDEAFPNAKPASSRFAKTAFVGSDEPTLTQLAPSDAIRDALNDDNARGTMGGEFGSRPSRLQEFSDEQPISQENESIRSLSWWTLSENIHVKTILIGFLTVILLGLLAYLLLND
ncbi:MAG: hypothetical protein NTX25_09835 [Proteobacteria bacterium]|nr:hypothetical protein [Pseudomonadota bacterium]